MNQWGNALLREIEGLRVEKGSIAMWSIGGAGIVYKSSESTLYIDPYVGGSTPPDFMRMIAVPFPSSSGPFPHTHASTQAHRRRSREEKKAIPTLSFSPAVL